MPGLCSQLTISSVLQLSGLIQTHLYPLIYQKIIIISFLCKTPSGSGLRLSGAAALLRQEHKGTAGWQLGLANPGAFRGGGGLQLWFCRAGGQWGVH